MCWWTWYKNNTDIKAHIVNIKYNLIIGLETIKENNLTIRYPSIFSSSNELDGLICQPCAEEESEKEGRWAIRAAQATSSSTELSDKSEVVGKELPTSNPKHPVKRVTFKDDTPIDSDRESIGLDESSETPLSENHQNSHRKEERDDTTGETNFSGRHSFEVDDLLDNNGAKLEAIPADMLYRRHGRHSSWSATS